MIPIPLAGLTGVFDAPQFWQNIATVFGAAAVWAQRKAQPEQDPVEALTFRLRHPVRSAMSQPIVTLRRKLDRRRSI